MWRCFSQRDTEGGGRCHHLVSCIADGVSVIMESPDVPSFGRASESCLGEFHRIFENMGRIFGENFGFCRCAATSEWLLQDSDAVCVFKCVCETQQRNEEFTFGLSPADFLLLNGDRIRHLPII